MQCLKMKTLGGGGLWVHASALGSSITEKIWVTLLICEFEFKPVKQVLNCHNQWHARTLWRAGAKEEKGKYSEFWLLSGDFCVFQLPGGQFITFQSVYFANKVWLPRKQLGTHFISKDWIIECVKWGGRRLIDSKICSKKSKKHNPVKLNAPFISKQTFCTNIFLV